MKTTHTKQNKKSTKRDSKSLLTGSLVALVIVISPYLFYLYESFPDVKVWKTSLFTYESYYFESVQYVAWHVVNKLIPILLLILWFFTCRDWWYHAIIIPIAMFSFQLYSVVNDDLKYHDEIEIYYVIPIMMIIIPVVYFIRIKLFDKHVYGIDIAKIDAELAEYDRKEREMLEENK
jgi:hypothetical protein